MLVLKHLAISLTLPQKNTMLQIGFIRQNTALVKERLSVKNFGDLSLVDKVVALDERYVN